MKVLVLAGGRGERLQGVTDCKNKCMLKINGKPLIENSLEYAVSSGLSEIVIVVGYRAEEIINTYGIEYRGKKVKYAIQEEQKGLVHAIECSKDALEGEDFLLLLGDEVMSAPRHQMMINKFRGRDIFGLCGIRKEKNKERISRTYSIMQDERNRIYRLIEKPKNPMNNLMGTGSCVFRNELLEYIPQTPINQNRGEKELPDLIQCAVDQGKVVKSFRICDKYANVNTKEDLAEAKKIISKTD